MAENCKSEVITLGTMIRGGEKTLPSLKRFIPIGIESVELFFWDKIPESIDTFWMEEIRNLCQKSGIKISSLGLYANPLRNSESKNRAKSDWNTLLDFAEQFNIPVVSGFTGRVPNTVLEDSYLPVKDFFSPLVERCEAKNIKLVFENCPMEGDRLSGDWNIAFLPEVWEILINDLFQTDTVGLEFDPAHCVQLGLPVLDLLEQWIFRIYHFHGKDASGQGFGDFSFPGEGICDWKKIMTLLKNKNYQGSVDLEGYHGSFISHEHELEMQKKCLKFLRANMVD